MARFFLALLLLLAVLGLLAGCGGGGSGNDGGGGNSSLTVIGFNDLGMHCMNSSFKDFMVLPPANTLHAQVIDRSGEEPHIVTNGVVVSYSIPSNTHSADKTDFWTYVQQLMGISPAPNVGITGNGLAGTMSPGANSTWIASAIPITPINDAGIEDPYPLATIRVSVNGQVRASTQAVVPVSWEMNCNLCHNSPGVTVERDVLQDHDRLHGTTLDNQRPVRCGQCHAQAPLGAFAPGQPGLPNLSNAMHTAHASRMTPVLGQLNNNSCYACHPGVRTQCLRDVHASEGMTCTDCHGNMTAVANPSRRPWVDEPRCGDCHSRAGFEFEQPNTLFKDSRGHHGIACATCHNTPHAITPTRNSQDNVQAIALQGYAGPVSKCTVCHSTIPDDSFNHSFSDDD